MSIESLVHTAILANGALTAVIGTGTLARSYPDFLALEIPLPGIVVEKPDTEYINTIHSGVPAGSFQTIVITSLAINRIDAEALADLVETAVAVTATGLRAASRNQDFYEDTLTYAAVSTFQL